MRVPASNTAMSFVPHLLLTGHERRILRITLEGVALGVPGCFRVRSSVTLAWVLQDEAQLGNQHQENEEKSLHAGVCAR